MSLTKQDDLLVWRQRSFTGKDDLLLWRQRSFTGKDDLLLWTLQSFTGQEDVEGGSALQLYIVTCVCSPELNYPLSLYPNPNPMHPFLVITILL